MPMVSPTLNLPTPAASSSMPPAGPAPLPPLAPPVSLAAQARMPDAPSTTVTLSPQAMSAMAAGHPSSPGSTAGGSPVAAPAAQGGSLYDSIKNGISTAVEDTGDAIASGAHAVVDGVETALTDANRVATGILEFPFAAASKAADAVGSFIDKL